MKELVLNALRSRSKQRPLLRADFPALNLSDRKVRELIAELQQEGFDIVSLKKGYYLAENGDLEKYIEREKRRAISILAKLKHLRSKTEDIIKQLELL